MKKLLVALALVLAVSVPVSAKKKIPNWPVNMPHYLLEIDDDKTGYYLETLLPMSYQYTDETHLVSTLEFYMDTELSQERRTKILAQRKKQGKSIKGWTDFRVVTVEQFKYTIDTQVLEHRVTMIEYYDVKTQKQLEKTVLNLKFTNVPDDSIYWTLAQRTISWIKKYLR